MNRSQDRQSFSSTFIHYTGTLPEQATSFRRVQYFLYITELQTERWRIDPDKMPETWNDGCVTDTPVRWLNVATELQGRQRTYTTISKSN